MESACDEKTILIIKKLVNTIAEREGFKDFKLEINQITTNGANYMGDLFLVDVLEKGKETLKLFAKTANTSEQARAMIPAHKMYEAVVFMYTTMADTFNELQEKYALPKEKRFIIPKYYGSNLTKMEELIVLENLASQGFELFDRLKPIDWEYAKAAIEEIAKFHALSFAFEKENPDLFEKLVKSRRSPIEENAQAMADSIQASLPLALSVIEPDHLGVMKKYVEENGHQLFFKIMAPSKFSTLIHGDYRMSNIMVKYQDSSLVSLKPIDYQTACNGNPLMDLLYFLFTGSDEDFRRQHFEDFFLHYHTTLAAQLQLLSQDVNDIYPRSSFYFDLKDKLLFGLEVGLVTLGMVLIDPSEVITIDDMLNMATFEVNGLKPNDAYAKRINGIVKDFVRWGFLNDDSNSTDTFISAPSERGFAIKDAQSSAKENQSDNKETVTDTKTVKKKKDKCCALL